VTEYIKSFSHLQSKCDIEEKPKFCEKMDGALTDSRKVKRHTVAWGDFRARLVRLWFKLNTSNF
jgi:hypothetical protein